MAYVSRGLFNANLLSGQIGASRSPFHAAPRQLPRLAVILQPCEAFPAGYSPVLSYLGGQPATENRVAACALEMYSMRTGQQETYCTTPICKTVGNRIRGPGGGAVGN